MKKRLWSMLLVVVMLASMLPMSALAADSCAVCGAALVQKSDASGHWAECENPNYNGANCTEYGKRVGEASHAMEYKENPGKTGHWEECTVCHYQGPYGEHNFIYDESVSTEDKAVGLCVCGKTSDLHTHLWAATYTTNDTEHYYVCDNTDGLCPLTDSYQMKGYDVHAWGNSTPDSTGANITWTCDDCGKQKTEHNHIWSDANNLKYDSTGHWRECVSCGEKYGYEAHLDTNGNGKCDGSACAYVGVNGGSIIHKQLIIKDLDYPYEGNKIDFTATASPFEFGTAHVKWNRVENLSKNTSTAMTKDNVFAAGRLYNASVTVYLNAGATLASDFYIDMHGYNVPVYTKADDFNKEIKKYDGSADVAAAMTGVNDSGWPYITVCYMYAQLPGECTHPNVDYNGKWEYTGTHHYLQCDICGKVTNNVKHFDFNGNGTCDRCGYNPNVVVSTGGTHTHSWSTDWVEDISNHWHQCSTCGAKKDQAAHADPNGNGKCDTCGFVMKPDAGHTHSYATTWTETAYQHYHLCSCGAKNDIGAHRDTNNSGLCDDCGYTMNAALNAVANGTVANVGGTAVLGGVVPGTGDTNSMAATYLWMAALAVSVMGLFGCMVAWRKRFES